VYIKEAHALDGGFDFGDNEGWGHVKTATALSERLAAAKDWVKKTGASTPYFCDTMEDTGRLTYEAFPERLYIIEDGKIAYKGGPGPMQYNVEEVDAWLKKRFQSRRV